MPFTMGYYDRADIPFYYALADAFTICDQNFCSTLTGTTPNRLHLWTGTIRAKQEASSIPNVRNEDVDFGSTVSWKTFPERLEEAGISWRIYQNELSVASGLEGEHDAWLANFGDNPLEWFDQYNVGFRKTHLEYLEHMAATLPAEIEKLRAEGSHAKALKAAKEKLLKYVTANARNGRPQALAQLSARQIAVFTKKLSPPTRKTRIIASSPRCAIRTAASTVKCWFPNPIRSIASAKMSTTELCPPSPGWLPPTILRSSRSPWYGAWYVAETLNILTKNPEVWSKTIFILTYDENDGYFDHVPPFVAPEPGNPESGKTPPASMPPRISAARSGSARRSPEGSPRRSVGLGFRVPLMVASPWSRGGYVCSQVFDHTSVLHLLERC